MKVRVRRSATDALFSIARRGPWARPLRVTRGWADRAFLRLGRPPLAGRVGDVRLRGFLRHRAFLARLEGYETETVKVFREFLRPDSVVVDGGSHVGLFTLIASSVVGERGRIYAFEPDPYNFSALAYNV